MMVSVACTYSLHLCWMLRVFASFALLFDIGVLGQEVKRPQEQSDEDDDHFFKFFTRPDIQAPKFNVTIYDEDALAPGYIFVSSYEDADKMDRGMPWVGPYIYDANGDLIWSGAPFMDHYKLWDFRVAKYHGADALSGISQRDNAGFILNNQYELVKSIQWSPRWSTSNMHEFHVGEDGKRVLVITKEERKELSVELSREMGLKKGRCEVTKDGIKELDITGQEPEVLFEWRGIDHIPVIDSVPWPDELERRCRHNVDLHHINSIDKFPDGSYLISARHISSIYRINTDGTLAWTLGGPSSDYDVPSELLFWRQHHARFVEENSTHTVISLFDNAIGWNGPEHDCSRGLVLALNNEQKTVSLVSKADHPLNEITEARGNNQLLPNGNRFLCWVTSVSEHGPDGEPLMHAVSKAGIVSYRGYKFPWIGAPKQPPNVYSAAFFAGEIQKTTTYVSWNGATEVATWKLYESDAEGVQLKPLREKERTGFETRMISDEFVVFVVMEALDWEGKPIGRSKVVRTTPAVEFDEAEEEESWTFRPVSNPIYAFVVGLIISACVCAGAWFLFRNKMERQRQLKGVKYDTAEAEEREVLFADHEDEEDIDEDGIELSDKPDR